MRFALAARNSALHILIIAAAMYLYYLVGTWDFAAPGGRLGPDVWPKAILFLLIGTCAFAVVRNFVFARRGGADAGTLEEIMRLTRGGAEDATDTQTRSMPHLVAIGAGLLVAYVLVLETLGFLVSTILLMAAFMYVGRWRNVPGIVVTSLVGGLAFFYVFRGIVYVSLPLGRGPFETLSLLLTQLLHMR